MNVVVESRRQSKGERTCVGCGQTAPAQAARRASARLQADESAQPLVRLVLKDTDQGVRVAVDTGATSFGRGAYVHATARCVNAAATRGLPKAAKAAVQAGWGEGAPAAVSGESLAAAISEAYARRARALVGAARRAGKVEIGSAAVTAAGRAGRSELVLVAVDAAQAADLSEVRRAFREARAIPWPSMESLADALQAHGSVGVAAVTDSRLGRAIQASWLVVSSLSPERSILPEGAATLRDAGGSRDGRRNLRAPRSDIA